MSEPDARRRVPRTDRVLADPRLTPAVSRIGAGLVKGVVVAVQQRVRAGQLGADQVVEAVLEELPGAATTLRPVLNATGVVLHTNLGRAPLSAASVEALRIAAGYVDIEYDISTGARSRRGRGALQAVRDAVPDAGDVLVVNNGAAALVLATTALAADREVVVSRGEMVEIGDGFRLPDLIASTGASLREVGSTNRTRLQDYADAVGPRTGAVLKVHRSNFTVDGYTAAVDVAQLASLGVPVIADVGSGLMSPDPLLPDEPDVRSALRAGAHVATCSGDKLLGGPQAGLLLGARGVVEQLRRHPLARALRVDKLTMAALEATLAGPPPPVHGFLHADADDLRARAQRLAAAVGGQVVPHDGVVGGGGAPGLVLPGWAVSLEEGVAARLRRGRPCVVARVDDGRCLVDLRCVPPHDDDALLAAVMACTS